MILTSIVPALFRMLVAAGLLLFISGSAAGQDLGDDEALLNNLAQPQTIETDLAATEPSGIDLITLITRGGYFMWPIGLMSLLVVALAAERLVSFRRNKMVPKRLVRGLSELVRQGNGSIDAEKAFQVCRENRSSAASVVSAMLMRTGRPLSEIETAATETAQREADSHAGPIRWLNLAASATPLMGLLGTVWGMIVAFHNSSNLTADRSRSEQLSEGIYTALVTTLAGLAVAIPAAMLAQYLENRLARMFHKIEALAFSLAPSLEHYSGRQRLDSNARLQPVQTNQKSSNHPVLPPPVSQRSNEPTVQRAGEAANR